MSCVKLCVVKWQENSLNTSEAELLEAELLETEPLEAELLVAELLEAELLEAEPHIPSERWVIPQANPITIIHNRI